MNGRFRKGTVAILVVALLLGTLAIPSQDSRAASKKVSIAKKAKVTVGKTAKIKLKNNKKKVKWKVVNGKKQLKITKKTGSSVTVKGLKQGTAKVQAVVGKKKYTCKVTVSAAKKKAKATGQPQAAASNMPQTIASATTEPPSVDAPTMTVNPASRTIVYDGTNLDEIKKATDPISLIIQEGVTAIEQFEFYECKSLTSISIPASVTSIGYSPFRGCDNVAKIIVSDKNPVYDSRDDCNAIIETESNTLVVGCGNTIIPNSVKGIGYGAFWGCNKLTNIIIPASVTDIGYSAIGGCDSLARIVISEKNPIYDSRNDCNAIIETASSTLIAGCGNTIIPDSVTSIGHGAFAACSNLTSITIPNSVKSIGMGAFSGCSSLERITISESVTSMEADKGDAIFSGCVSLTKIVVSEKNPVYDSRDDCNAIIETASNTLIAGCGNTMIPASVTSIGDLAFAYTSLTSITIPAGVTSIGYYLCRGCNLTKIAVSEKNPVYDSRGDCNAIIETETNTLVMGCENTVIPDSVMRIQGSAFFGCGNLTDITIPDGVTYIGYEAFCGCSNLTSITIPGSVTHIGGGAFSSCSALTRITISDGVTYIGEDAFDGCSSLTDITIPDSVTEIDTNAFRDCSSLTSITIPDSVTSITNAIFSGCDRLSKIVVSENNPVYDSRNQCNAIIETETNTLIAGCGNSTIPDSVTSIGWRAFDKCSSLKSIAIPDSVTNIEWGVFRDCSSLASITWKGTTYTSVDEFQKDFNATN